MASPEQPNSTVPVDIPNGDSVPPEAPQPHEKAEDEYQFNLPVDENNKAKVLKIYSIARPHMRAFHFAWLSFFLAFFGWFALSPLQAQIRDNNTWLQGIRFKYQNIVAVAGTIFMRLLIGPVCDRFGPRFAQSSLLGVFSLPVFLVGTARNYASWTTARFFIGFIGATFVVTQFWTSIMFAPTIVGTANATSAGWGNLGGGVTNVIMPLIRRGISRSLGNVTDAQDKVDDTAWRIAMVIPGAALVIVAVSLWFLADDLPEGNYRDLHRSGKKEKTNPFKAMGRAAGNWRVWILFILYAGCFGIELIMNANLATYFSGNKGREPFTLNERTAGVVAGVFGLMNLFARSIGGIGSDFFSHRYGLRGRLWWFFVVQFTEGCFFVGFSQAKVIAAAIPLLIMFSLFVQMSEGATFGIVPFVDPEITGAVSGIVGAGGNFGAVAGGFLLNPSIEGGMSRGFRNLGFIVIATSFLVGLLYWPQYGGMFCKPSDNAGKVVEEDDEKEDDQITSS